MKSLAILIFCSLPAVAAPQWRGDLQKAAKPMCGGQMGLQDMWKVGIYDLQIEGEFVKPRVGYKITNEYLESRAKGLAELRHYGGYYFGVCPDGRGIVVATPSSKPLLGEFRQWRVPVQELDARCKEWRMDYAAASGGTSRKIEDINRRTLRTGTVAVTCQPKLPRWLGNQEWFLIPTTAAKLTLPKFQPNGSKLREQLVNWIQSIRTEPLAEDPELDRMAGNMAFSRNIAHNRSLLSAVDKGSSRFKVIGENRVEGATFTEIAFLLWNSPRHRDLLLNPSQTHLGLAVMPKGKKSFVVMLGARAIGVSTQARK